MNDSKHDLPFVSIIMPIRNESTFIEDCLNAILSQNYPEKKFEVIVVDGLSDDGTTDILRRFKEKYNKIKIFKNDKKIVSTALNIGISKSIGDIIVRIDGHTIIKKDFISKNIELLNKHEEAWIVGGPIIHKGKNSFSKALALTMSSSFGVGNANHRKSDYEGYAEGAVFPAIRKFVFSKVGLFDEHFVRNQDDEFNYRVILNGGKIFISPSVSHSYFVRDSASKLFKQYFQYGFWKIEIIKKHRSTISIRHLIPLFFVIYLKGLVFLLFVTINLGAIILSLVPLLTYLVLVVFHILVTLKNTKAFSIGLLSGYCAIIMHIAYGVGTFAGIFPKIFLNSKLNKLVTELSR
jgi:succinoglycan biosynthesis protein ExoA